MDKNDLLKIILEDEYGILELSSKRTSSLTDDERLISSFHEINQYVSKHGREPKAGGDIYEHQLYARLKGIRENKDKIRALLDLDEHSLLDKQKKPVNSIEDIFEDDNLGIFDNDAAVDIFDIKHLPKETTMPDYVANRKSCKDFAKFKDVFTTCQAEIASGRRKLWPFKKEQQISKGMFFVLKGILLYIADVGEREIIGGRSNARLHCIFENATESDMLLRSLSAELYKNGRRVTETGNSIIDSQDVSINDKEEGYVYILRSLSNKNEIQSIKNLYKIGFSRVPIESRIKNADKEPTFLMAPVSIVNAYKCYNMNPQKLELLLHTFFGSACLNIDVFDNEGKRYTPREWFVAPLDIIEQAITFVINGEIVNYKYDHEKQIIVGR